MKTPITGTEEGLSALGIKQRVSFDEAQALCQELHSATGLDVWPGLSGNAVYLLVNLAISRKEQDYESALKVIDTWARCNALVPEHVTRLVDKVLHKRITPLSQEQYEQNLMQHGIIR